MAGRVTAEIKERILARTDIVEVIGARLALKRAGVNFQACCPFHDDKTPSFTVSPDKQFYHCFGCGAHGNVIDFLIEYDRLSFPEAIEELAQRVGIVLEGTDRASGRGPDTAPLYRILEQVTELYRAELHKPSGAAALGYLRQRGLMDASIERFALGFAPPGWGFLSDGMGRASDARAGLLAAGLLVEREGRCYDRFRGRVMFPIRDRRGRVIAFGGRVLDGAEPKYLNSPETSVFSKGRHLYGLYEAQQALRDLPRLLVVEGYVDVIALVQFGIPYAVATLGTATTDEHLRVLQRCAGEIVFCFDGDRAGRSAATKALKIALPTLSGHHALRFLFLPDGQDPDSLIRARGREAFEDLIEKAKPLSETLFESLLDGHSPVTPEERARLEARARPLIETIPAGTYRQLLLRRLAELVGLNTPVASGHVAPRAWPSPRRDSPLTPVRLAIALLLREPRLAVGAATLAAELASEGGQGTALLRQIMDRILAMPEQTTAALREYWRGTEHERVVFLLSDRACTDHIPDDGCAAELHGALNLLLREFQKRQRWQLISSGLLRAPTGKPGTVEQVVEDDPPPRK